MISDVASSGEDTTVPSSSPSASSNSDLQARDELLHEVLQDLHPLTTQREFDLEDFLWTGSGNWLKVYLKQIQTA